MAMIAELKYGSGVPFNRIENLEKRLRVPLSAAAQWEIVEEATVLLRPARDELIRQAAQGELFHNDDTSVRILKHGAARGRRANGGVHFRNSVGGARGVGPRGHRRKADGTVF